ncbi:hypothetical protein LG651_06710 [Tamlana sp. 62-3]|uniref:Uncharacterized protein n=1 Tax=Neotamlana sargassicola TaxID=2883125 RepID=A0A9X1I5Q8_9FLAO|nr:hypothetical protein [Tamlana sargassicola]MCB4807938.1 hypothetical protein [Tamlana sargassicola]
MKKIKKFVVFGIITCLSIVLIGFNKEGETESFSLDSLIEVANAQGEVELNPSYTIYHPTEVTCVVNVYTYIAAPGGYLVKALVSSTPGTRIDCPSGEMICAPTTCAI